MLRDDRLAFFPKNATLRFKVFIFVQGLQFYNYNLYFFFLPVDTPLIVYEKIYVKSFFTLFALSRIKMCNIVFFATFGNHKYSFILLAEFESERCERGIFFARRTLGALRWNLDALSTGILLHLQNTKSEDVCEMGARRPRRDGA